MKIFKCKRCGNIVELLNDGNGVLTCCGEAMMEIVADIEEDALYVKIGEVDHPMTDEHYIEWVAAVYDDSVLKYNFKPGEVPEAVFDYEEGMVVYAYCNLHGLWKKEL